MQRPVQRGRLGRIAAGAVFLLALTGCQTTPRQADVATAGEGVVPQSVLLPQFAPKWLAEGKIALKHQDESTNASFTWEQKHQNYVIRLFGPFGQGSTWIRRTSKSVTLENAKTGYRKAESAEALMEDLFGWQVPVSDLQYWIRGLVAPDVDAEVTEEVATGLILGLEQQGWAVTYESHQKVDGWVLPRRLVAVRDGMEVTLVIKRWDLPPAPTGLP